MLFSIQSVFLGRMKSLRDEIRLRADWISSEAQPKISPFAQRTISLIVVIDRKSVKQSMAENKLADVSMDFAVRIL